MSTIDDHARDPAESMTLIAMLRAVLITAVAAAGILAAVTPAEAATADGGSMTVKHNTAVEADNTVRATEEAALNGGCFIVYKAGPPPEPEPEIG